MHWSKGDLEINLWYYYFSKAKEENNANSAIYFDIAKNFSLKEYDLNIGIQFLKEYEKSKSNIAATIYGVSFSLQKNNLTFNIAYNKALKKRGKRSFSGYGGGTLFTNIDSMILDEIIQDRSARAIVGGFSYSWNKFTFSYCYGDFRGGKNSKAKKEHIIEHDIGLEYQVNKNLTFSAIYVIAKNRQYPKSNEFNFKNLRVEALYRF